jgi:formate hydrogenlyase subunit 6/NADH:ubiquinone oxidoreductase subunit I
MPAAFCRKDAMSKKSKNRVLESWWRQVELPVLAETLCTGCGWCVEACPTQCLAQGIHVPWLPRPLDCVSCTLCVVICPAHALEMKERE